MFQVVRAMALAAMFVTSASAQSIRGYVRDAEQQPLQGTTVQIENTNTIAITDALGFFRFNLLPANAVLVVSFVGYQTQRVAVTDANTTLGIYLSESTTITDEVVIRATRATDNSPTTFLNIDKQTLQQQNFGQDLPFVLHYTPSLVTTSDAGAGIGYTGLRIRGSDATRINVTINGIPYNDSESQGTFWVNLPDITSSTQSIQIQRGVGTSTNGGSAFGASVNLQTSSANQEAFAEATMGGGSFNTRRYTFKAGTGLINNTWAFEGRVSQITSDGYIDRASSDLNSYFLSGGYYAKKTIIKALAFGGQQQTYQAYWGVDEATMKTNRTLNYAGAIYDSNFTLVDYYDNQVDDYRQDHYQLHLAQQFNNAWTANVAFHYTYGRGFFELYQQQNAFANVGLDTLFIGTDTIATSNMIERRWLDNDFYGTTFSVQKDADHYSLIIGGAYNTYTNAKHFGEIIWAEFAQKPVRHQYYQGESAKNDFNVFAKLTHRVTEKLTSFADLQYRSVSYRTSGVDDDLSVYSVQDNFSFFNPKAGLTYQANASTSVYTSFAVANREPNRSDYLDGEEKPRKETLYNVEAGMRRTTARYNAEVNYYWMKYNNQLVLTGEINNTGYPLRANIGESYRTGLELSGTALLTDKLTLAANATASLNQNQNMAIVNQNGDVEKRNTTIILSPSLIAGGQLTWSPTRGAQLSLLSKYVSAQYLDNSENENLKLDAYFVADVRASYAFTANALKGLEASVLVNNLLNAKYVSNGYSYASTAYLFPQAGTNFLAMVTVRF
jgi:iron complex outermembrane recepter protein